MKITLSTDDQVVAKARRIAAARDTSLNQLIRGYLEDLARQSGARDIVEQLDTMCSEGTGRSHGPGCAKSCTTDREGSRQSVRRRKTIDIAQAPR